MAKNNITVKTMSDRGPAGFVLFVAYIGAAVYFINQASGFWEVVWSLIKAGAWPGILIYHIFTVLRV